MYRPVLNIISRPNYLGVRRVAIGFDVYDECTLFFFLLLTIVFLRAILGEDVEA